MSSRSGPRSASDATRFTSTTPQPNSKTASSKAGPVGETLEQRVKRLRAAHLAARNAPLSTYDKVTMNGRKVFDVMHRATLVGLIGFTVVAGVFSVYAVFDMLKMNRSRREDFIQAKRKMENDTLQTARVAFLNGSATDEQTNLVENAIRDAEQSGTKLAPLLSSPPKWQTDRDASVAAAVAATAGSKKEGGSIWEQVDAQVKAEGGDIVEKEKENQRRGGPLDRLGAGTSAPKEGSGSKWWPW